MEFVISFIVAVAAGVACHYIIKWLDSDRKGNKQPSGCFATIKEKKNPQTVRYYGLGIHSAFSWNCHIFLPIGIIAYAKTFFNMLLPLHKTKIHPYLASFKSEYVTYIGNALLSFVWRVSPSVNGGQPPGSMVSLSQSIAHVPGSGNDNISFRPLFILF